MEKTNYILKGLGYSYILTLATLLIYNLALTFTSLSGNSIAMASSAITTASSAFGGFYASKNIKEKGLIYVFDSSKGVIIYDGGGVDVLPDVKKKLGLQ